MSRYSDLGLAYGRHRSAHIDYMHNCGALIVRFANAFREYLEAPEFYEEYINGIQADPVREKTVSVMEARRDRNGEISFEKMQADRRWPDLIRSDDGNWIAAIRLVVEEAPNTWPKSGYYFPVFFSVNHKRCRMHIGEEHRDVIEFDADDVRSAHRAFDFMIGWLHEVYQRDPAEIRINQPIGFILPGRE